MTPASAEVLVPIGAGARSRGDITVHRSGNPDRLAPRYVEGIPVTSPSHTLLDLAGLITDRELERALDEALALRLVRVEEVAHVVAANRTRRGALPLARHVRSRLDGTLPLRTHRGAEEMMLAILRAGNVTGFRVNVKLDGWEVDVWWPHLRLAVEVDSFRWHSQRGSWARDHRKAAYMRDHGIELMRVSWDQLADEAMAVLARVVRAVADREQRVAAA